MFKYGFVFVWILPKIRTSIEFIYVVYIKKWLKLSIIDHPFQSLRVLVLNKTVNGNNKPEQSDILKTNVENF